MLIPVAGDYRPPGLEREPVFYIEVEKRNVCTVINAAKTIVPPQGAAMQHIKRVKPLDNGKLAVLVCAQSRMPAQQLAAELEEIVGFTVELKESGMARYPARTAEEAAEWSEKVWPMMWRGNIRTQLPELPDWEYAESKLASLPDSANAQSTCCAECWIVDPSIGKLRGSGTETSDHPLKHGVMQAIAAVAEDNSVANGYLCQNLDVFCSQEPCIMCCMALVHSRIARLFYVMPSSSSKGAIEYYCLHGRAQLNHTFEAWVSSPVSHKCSTNMTQAYY